MSPDDPTIKFDIRLDQHADYPSIATIVVDNPPVNAMSLGVPGAIISRLRDAAGDPDVRGVVLLAGGRGGFAGADIRTHGRPWPEDEPRLVDLVHELDRTAKPVAILMRAHALGGGLEIAQACHFRLATPGTRLGQPEVKLGIPPGAGATQRMPRLIGVERALDIIVSGEPIDAETGLDLGLVDHLIGPGSALDDAARWLDARINSDLPVIPARELPIKSFDHAVFQRARETAARRNRGQKSPQVCVDCVEAATRLPFDEGIAFERAQFEVSVSSDEAAALRHVFFAEGQARKIPNVSIKEKGREIESAAVIGAGTMGSGIAMCLANAGIPVTLIEQSEAPLDRAMTRIRETYTGSVARGRLSNETAEDRISLVTPQLSIEAVASADLVIEAVFEDMAIKKSVFAALAQVSKPDAILATNTSYLDVNEIAAAAGERRSNVLGLHFFSPANVMALLEIVRGTATSDESIASAAALARRIGKVGIVSGVCHGFIANRTYSKYLREAEFLLEEGATPNQVDKALTDFGMAMGPFAVRDLAGLDIGWAMRKSTAHERDPSKRYSSVCDKICENGWFGQKTGRGFYLYEPGSRTPRPDPAVDNIIARCASEAGIQRREISDKEIIERCLYAVVNEGARVLEEGIAARASDFNLVWLNGYGFPRWRGGPLHWADRQGLADVLARINAFNTDHDFWDASKLLRELAESGSSFSLWDRARTT